MKQRNSIIFGILAGLIIFNMIIFILVFGINFLEKHGSINLKFILETSDISVVKQNSSTSSNYHIESVQQQYTPERLRSNYTLDSSSSEQESNSSNLTSSEPYKSNHEVIMDFIAYMAVLNKNDKLHKIYEILQEVELMNQENETKEEEILTEETLDEEFEVEETWEDEILPEETIIDYSNCPYNCLIINGNPIEVVIDEPNQDNVNCYDVVQDSWWFSNSRDIFFFGHSYGSFSILNSINLDDTITLINYGIPHEYVVFRSDLGYVTDDNLDIISNDDGQYLVSTSYNYETIRLITCASALGSGWRYVITAYKVS